MDNELKQLIRKNVKFIDLRSEQEFRKGSIPNAVNMPILTSSEYESVGIEYKLHGKTAAIRLGYKLVSGEVKKERIKDWCTFINKNPKIIYVHWDGVSHSSGSNFNMLVQIGDSGGVETSGYNSNVSVTGNTSDTSPNATSAAGFIVYYQAAASDVLNGQTTIVNGGGNSSKRLTKGVRCQLSIN